MRKLKTPEQKQKALDATKRWQQENPEKYKESTRKYYEANREKMQAKNRDWHAKNPGYSKQWREDNKEAHRASIKQWNIDNAEHVRTRNKEWRENNKEHSSNTRTLRLYGITFKEKMALIAYQDGRCAVCGDSVEDVDGWHVEHDHVTSQVRGMTCSWCNRLLAMLGDQLDTAVEVFERVMHYLTVVANIETPMRLKQIRDSAIMRVETSEYVEENTDTCPEEAQEKLSPLDQGGEVDP